MEQIAIQLHSVRVNLKKKMDPPPMTSKSSNQLVTQKQTS